jgi:hypothetical protein
LRLGFWGLIQQVRNVGPSAHLQARRDPLQTHGRFLPQATCQLDLGPVSLPARPQLVLIPAKPFHFFQMPAQLVPDIKTLGVNTQQPLRCQMAAKSTFTSSKYFMETQPRRLLFPRA